jgi:DNA repair exonuclease SbcCD ATPase subunit
MILFKTIKYKNLLAAGNNPITINLNDGKSSLIVGQNGAGKSTIIEALVFALFNKSFRKVNKAQLINSINEKDCRVEVDFSIGRNEYKIIRGMKPNIFEIHINGNLIDQVSANTDQQKYLEQNILKLNYKSFTQIVILGSSTFVPFMQLPAAHRREIIEDLLDIRIFSTMNVILKDRIKVTSEELKDFDREIELLKEKTKIQKKHIDYIASQSQKNIEEKQFKITELLDEISVTEFSNDMNTIEIFKLNESLDGLSLDNLKELEKFKIKFTSKLNDSVNYKSFYEENDVCPQCHQDISNDIKSQHVEKCESEISKMTLAMQEVESSIEQAQKNLEEKNKILTEISRLNLESSSLNYKCKTLSKSIDDLKKEIDKISGGDKNLEEEKKKLTELATQGMTLQKQIDKHKFSRSNYDIVSNLLKDTGIKSKIIKKYLPVMNQLINKYLHLMDFYVNFTLDENFDESIKSRFRDDFSYSSFSEGEKMRIDLALMFTWRAIAKLKNSANTNLLILDEVFDSSLDVAGTEDFMRIIRGIDSDTNIFVISHKGDILMDKFEKVLKFEKSKNFSTVQVS